MLGPVSRISESESRSSFHEENVSLPASDMDVSHISGSASDEIKQAFSSPASFLMPAESGPIFGDSIVKKLVVTQISIDKKVEEPRKLECRFVLELTVETGTSRGFFTTCLHSHSVFI